MGYGVWSLVWGGLVQGIVSAAALQLTAPSSRALLFARVELRDLLQFGVGSSASTWMNYLARNGDNFIVGRYLGVESLGLYGRAYSLMNMPFTYAVNLMTSVLFPAMSRLQRDPARLQRAYLRMTALTGVISAPVMVAMAIAAPDLIATLYGPQWQGAVVPLQILCAFGYFRALYHVGGIIAQSAGHVYGELRNQVLYAALVLAGATLGRFYGLSGVSVGVGLAIAGMFIATTRLALLATNTSWRLYASGQVAAAASATATLAICVVARTVLENYGVPTAAVAGTLITLAAFHIGVGVLWVLSGQDFLSTLPALPSFVSTAAQRVKRMRQGRTPAPTPK
jgi:O-antigen/teichoic acid export membrane protein